MTVIVNYKVDKELYHSSDTEHHIEMTMTEYEYKNEILVHLHLEKNMGIRLNNVLDFVAKREINFDDEQFLIRELHGGGAEKSISRDEFERRLKAFNMDKTEVRQEILENYLYIDEDNRSDEVKIAITVANDLMGAVIEFEDEKKYQNFIQPPWLEESAVKYR